MLSKATYFQSPISMFITVRFILGLALFVSLPWLLFMYEETVHGYVNLIVTFLIWNALTKVVLKYIK